MGRMTIDEAIKILKQTGGVINPIVHPVKNYMASEVYEAVNLAIKALEARPQGEWIGNELGQCSICGHKGCASDIWNGCNDKTYCPN